MGKHQQAYYGYELKEKSYEEYRQDVKVQHLKKRLKHNLGEILESHLPGLLGLLFLAFILVGSYILACLDL